METSTIDLRKSSVQKIFWTYAIPSILMMIVQSTVGLIDSFFIGKYVGPEGLSAITLVMPVMLILVGVATMFAVGGTTLAGIEKGKEDHKKANNYFNVTTVLLAVAGIIGTLIITLFLEDMASLIGAKGIVSTYMIQYGHIIGFFAPFFLMSFAFSFFLKLDGKPIVMVISMICGTVVNIILDYLLIAQFGLGIRGAALATGISQVAPTIIMFFIILRKSSWQFKKPVFKLEELKRIVFNGISELLSNISISLTGFILNMVIINKIGVSGVAAYAVALQVSNVVSSIGYGIAESTQTAISYNLGAKQLERVSSFRKLTMQASLIIGIVFFIGTNIFGPSIAKVFVNQAETVSLAVNILNIYSVAFLFIGANIAVGTYYTAIDDPVRSGFITVYRSFLALISGLLILPIILGNSGIWLTLVFAEVSTFVIGYFMIKKEPFGKKTKMLMPTVI